LKQRGDLVVDPVPYRLERLESRWLCDDAAAHDPSQDRILLHSPGGVWGTSHYAASAPGITGSRDLIRVAVARDPIQAIPLNGTYIGLADAFGEVEVKISIVSIDDGITP
jgi:hypothetical protein